MHHDLAEIASSAALDQGTVGCQAHAIDVAARLDVVQRVEHQVKAFKKRQVEGGPKDVGVVGTDIEAGIEAQHAFARHLGFGLAHMVGLEQKLAIKIGDLNGVQVHNIHIAETRQGHILQQLAANATSAYNEDLRKRLEQCG